MLYSRYNKCGASHSKSIQYNVKIICVRINVQKEHIATSQKLYIMLVPYTITAVCHYIGSLCSHGPLLLFPAQSWSMLMVPYNVIVRCCWFSEQSKWSNSSTKLQIMPQIMSTTHLKMFDTIKMNNLP